MWVNPTFFHREKSIGKNYSLRKVNIDTINLENIFDESTDHK